MRLTGFALIITTADDFLFQGRAMNLNEEAMSVKSSYQSIAKRIPLHHGSNARRNQDLSSSNNKSGERHHHNFFFTSEKCNKNLFFSSFLREQMRKIWQERRRDKKIYRNHLLARTHMTKTRPVPGSITIHLFSWS